MTIKDIYELAEKTAQKYNPRDVAPFPYDAIERDKDDLKIFFSDNKLDDNTSGIIIFVKEENRFYILINRDEPETRRNFTIAHELGHYFLHQDIIKSEELLIDGENVLINQSLFRLDDAKSSKIEMEANNFAASLIMPERLIKKAWNTLEDIEEVASVFKVSVSAMSIRLEKLGIL